MKKGSKLTLCEWRERMNELTEIFLGRSIWSYEGIHWDYLHATGCRPLEVFDALMEELRAVKESEFSNDGLVNV